MEGRGGGRGLGQGRGAGARPDAIHRRAGDAQRTCTYVRTDGRPRACARTRADRHTHPHASSRAPVAGGDGERRGELGERSPPRRPSQTPSRKIVRFSPSNAPTRILQPRRNATGSICYCFFLLIQLSLVGVAFFPPRIRGNEVNIIKRSGTGVCQSICKSTLKIF